MTKNNDPNIARCLMCEERMDGIEVSASDPEWRKEAYRLGYCTATCHEVAEAIKDQTQEKTYDQVDRETK